jgi:RNA-binding protein
VIDEGAVSGFKSHRDNFRLQVGYGRGGYNVPMQLTEKQRRHLTGLAHPLRPIILMGQAGLTDAVVAETTRALADHELIKVRLPGLDRAQRDAALQGLAERTGSAMITRIGHVAVLYRRGEPLPKIVLPD